MVEVPLQGQRARQKYNGNGRYHPVMRQTATSVASLRQRALSARRARPLLELAAGVALGLLGLSALLVEPVLRRQLPSPPSSTLFELLVVVPLVYWAAAALAGWLIQPLLAAHFKHMLERSQLLLWLLSGDLPPEQSRLAALLGARHEQAQRFSERLQRAAANWRALSYAAGTQPLPSQPLVQWWPLLGASGWTLAAWLVQSRYGFNPLLFPLLFIALAFHLRDTLLAAARDEFLLALVDELGPAHAEPPPD